MPAADLVFDDGDRVLAMGRLVRDGKDWWLDSRRVLSLASRTAGGRSELSTRLLGEDHIKALRTQDSGAARAWVHVIGVWRRNTITVEAIGAGSGRPEPDSATPTEQTAPAADLARVTTTFEAHRPDWAIESWRTQTDGAGGTCVVAEMLRVSHDLAQWADDQPDGLVRLDPSVRRHSP